MSADRAKLIARSQLPVQLAPRPLGQPAAAADGQQQQQQGGGDEESGAVRGPERARDPETYDEGDFYSQLLKELLESGGVGQAGLDSCFSGPAWVYRQPTACVLWHAVVCGAHPEGAQAGCVG